MMLVKMANITEIFKKFSDYKMNIFMPAVFSPV